MKKIDISKILFALTLLFAFACVDEFEDANPPLPLDAPFAYVTSSIEEETSGVPMLGGEEVTFSVNIVDAPGVLKDINFIFSKGGEVVSHTFDALKGKQSGSFDVTVKAPYNLDGTSTFTMEISDSQEEAKMLTISKVLNVGYFYEGADFTVEFIDDDGLAYPGDEVEVVITVNNVPAGAVGSIAITGSAAVTFPEGELESLIGQSSGTVTGTMTVGEVNSTGDYDINVAITDDLQNRQTVESAMIKLVCGAAVDISGTYVGIANGQTGGGSPQPYFQLPSTITFTQINPGQYEVDDLSFGVFSEIYGDASPAGVLDICGFTITGNEENEDQYGDTYEITGEIVEASPEAITIEWENSYGDSGTVTLVKQ